MTNYWMAVVSNDWVQENVKQNMFGCNHGSARNLLKIHKNDKVVYYSHINSHVLKTKYQKITAIGEIIDDQIYQGNFEWNKDAHYLKTSYFAMKEIPIEKLRQLSEWHHITPQLRYGFLKIDKKTYDEICFYGLNS